MTSLRTPLLRLIRAYDQKLAKVLGERPYVVVDLPAGVLVAGATNVIATRTLNAPQAGSPYAAAFKLVIV